MANQSQAAGRKPSHRLFVISGEGEGANWTEIGAAWPNKDGKGFNLICKAMPLTGLIVMREVVDKDGAQGDEQ